MGEGKAEGKVVTRRRKVQDEAWWVVVWLVGDAGVQVLWMARKRFVQNSAEQRYEYSCRNVLTLSSGTDTPGNLGLRCSALLMAASSEETWSRVSTVQYSTSSLIILLSSHQPQPWQNSPSATVSTIIHNLII